MPPVTTYSVGEGDLPRDIPRQPKIPLDLAANAAGGLTGGIAKLADAGLTLWQKLREGDDEKQVLDALTRADDRLAAYRKELDRDENYAERETKFSAELQRVYGEELGSIQMAGAQREFQRRFYTLGRSQTLAVRHDAQQAGIQLQRQSLQDATEALMNKAMFAGTEAERQVYLRQIDEAFRASVKNGTLSAIQAQSARRQTLSRFQFAQAEGLTHQNPGEAIAKLSDPKQFEYLTADQRQSLINRARTRGESLSTQARAEARATLHDYVQSRQTNQPVSADETARVEKVARAAGLGHQFERAKTFFDRVDAATAGGSLPQLRTAISQLEARGSVEDNAVARQLRVIEKRQTTDAARSFDRDFKAFEATRKLGGEYDKLDRLVADAQALGGNELADAVRQRDAFWNRMAIASKEAPSDVAARLEALKQIPTLSLEQLEEQAALQAAYARKLKEFTDDPAKAARAYYPTIDEGYEAARQAKDAAAYRRADEALIEAQRREGVPEQRIQLLTKGQAEAIEAKLQAGNGADVLPWLDAIMAQHGAERWPLIKAQLNRGKHLPGLLDVLASIPPGETQARTNLAAAMRLSDAEAGKVLGDKIKTITANVREGGEDAVLSMRGAAGGAEKAALFQNAAEKLARYYVITQGLDEGVASKRAWDDVFYKHWHVTSDGLRIPKINGQPVNEPADVRRAQRDAIKNLPNLDLMLPDGPDFGGQTASQRKRALIEAVGKNGRWITSADEKGMFLFVGPGIPVRRADGSPVYVPYPERPPPMPTHGHLTPAQRGGQAVLPKEYPNPPVPGRTWDGLPALQNPDGSHSTEVSITITEPDINGGRPTNIPTIWQGERLSERAAIERARKSGIRFKAYDSIDAAVEAAKKRSADKGRMR